MTRITESQARAMGIDVPAESKYHSRKVILDGHKFPSQKEAGRYAELKLLLRAGEITDLELQPAFVLQERTRVNRRWQRAIIYRADFRYKTRDGKTVVEDVKGHKTKVYLLKKKLLLARYPEIDFREV